MLRLYKSLSIQNDVFSKIPRDQLRMPPGADGAASASSGSEDEAGPRHLDMKASRLALVGQEDDGILLFAHDGYAKVLVPPALSTPPPIPPPYSWGGVMASTRGACVVREGGGGEYSAPLVLSLLALTLALPLQDAAGKASKRTFMNMYDMKTRELTTLFMHDYVIDVVSCSVNEERTLLGTVGTHLPRNAGDIATFLGARMAYV
jgi:hypothetical protein